MSELPAPGTTCESPVNACGIAVDTEPPGGFTFHNNTHPRSGDRPDVNPGRNGHRIAKVVEYFIGPAVHIVAVAVKVQRAI